MHDTVPLKSSYTYDEAVRATFPIFLSHLKQASFEFEQNIDKGQWESLAKGAHRAIGSAGTYGYPDVVDVARMLEQEAKSMKRRETASTLLGKFRKLVERIEAGVNGSADI